MKRKRESGQAVVVLLLPLAVCLVIMVVCALQAIQSLNFSNVNYGNSHGVIKHGGQAVAVRLALDCYNYDHKYIDPDNDRLAYCVEFEEGGRVRFGIQILERIFGDEWDEITAFIQKAGRTLEEFDAYMARHGYTRQ